MRSRSGVWWTAAVMVGLVLAMGYAQADAPPRVGSHHSHGRFTAAEAGFPPQPVGIRDVQPVVPAARAAVTEGGEQVEGEGVVPPRVGQSPLFPDEVEQAVRLAAAYWRSRGVTRVEALEGYAIQALEPDGTPFDSRMAYVTFHAGQNARPELLAWVDLAGQRVVRSRVELPPQPQGPSTDWPRQAPTERAAEVPRSGHVLWRGWSFDYDVSSRIDGISLADVTYQGVGVLARASLPAMTVFYDHPEGTPPEQSCGPFVDRLGPPELTPVSWAGDSEVVLREFSQYGQDWLELGILDTLGNYVLYQSWYVGEDGQLDGHIFAKGIECEFDHVHYPFWRLDFDLAGPADDQIVRATPEQQEEVLRTEFSLDADAAVDHAWQVRDAVTGDRVDIAFDDGSWNVPGQVIPEQLFSTNRVYGRLFHDTEHGDWRTAASSELGMDEGEDIDGQDLLLWYRGFLPHAVAEGPELWHATGVRLQLDLAPRYYIRPPR